MKKLTIAVVVGALGLGACSTAEQRIEDAWYDQPASDRAEMCDAYRFIGHADARRIVADSFDGDELDAMMNLLAEKC